MHMDDSVRNGLWLHQKGCQYSAVNVAANAAVDDAHVNGDADDVVAVVVAAVSIVVVVSIDVDITQLVVHLLSFVD